MNFKDIYKYCFFLQIIMLFLLIYFQVALEDNFIIIIVAITMIIEQCKLSWLKKLQ